jgi:hypothetical protein
MKEKKKKPKKENKRKRHGKKKAALQAFLGLSDFTNYGLKAGGGTYLFFRVNPTNVSVLSRESVEIKERHLMMVLSAIPDIRILCIDAAERFDENLRYLKERSKEHPDPKVLRLLKKDMQFLDRMQLEMATSRQFLFVKKRKEENDAAEFAEANRIEKIIAEQGFEVRRLKRGEIKRLLAIYFDASLNGQAMPDFDGMQYFNLEGEEDDAMETKK